MRSPHPAVSTAVRRSAFSPGALPGCLARCCLAGLAIAAALAGAGCGPSLDPYNRLTSLRVLAIASDPPQPAPGETTTLSALIYLPELGAGEGLPGVSYAWSWCPVPGNPDNGYQCTVTPAELAMLSSAGVALPPLDLGTGTTAKLAHTVNPAALAELCKGVPGIPANCDGGFPVEVRLTVKTAVDQIVSVTQVRLRLDGNDPPNLAPPIEGLVAVVGGAEVPIGVEPAVTLPRDAVTVIKAKVPASAIESYQGIDDNLQPARVQERLTFTWFVESGDTDSQRTEFATGVSFDRALRNKWTPALSKDYPKSESRLVVVARDNRGGVSWHDGIVRLEPTP